VLVLGDDVCPVERAAIAFARKNGVKTLLIQDGILDDDDAWLQWVAQRRRQVDFATKLGRALLRSMDILPDLTLLGLAGCHRLAVWGTYTKHVMVKHGVPEETINVTGSPRLDDLFSLARVQAARADHHKGGRTLLFASMLLGNMSLDSPAEDSRVMQSLDTLARSGWDVIVRPHPTEKPEDYRRLFESLHLTNLRLDIGRTVRDALVGCDFLLTYFSTIAVEALILGKPVFCLPMTALSQPAYIASGAVPVIDKIRDLSSWLNRLLNDRDFQLRLDSSRRQFINDYLGYTDAASSARVARLIETLLASNP
jgi:hypothetical protein